MISAGAKKDMLIVSFVHSLITVSKQTDTKEDESISNRNSNKDYKINKRIDSNLDRLLQKLQETISNLYAAGGKETAIWMKKNLEKRVGSTLVKLQQEKINLEMLGLWVLYCNFSEIKRPLHKEMKWLEDGNQFLNIADLMEQTKISDIQGDMNLIAYDVIGRIKG